MLPVEAQLAVDGHALLCFFAKRWMAMIETNKMNAVYEAYHVGGCPGVHLCNACRANQRAGMRCLRGEVLDSRTTPCPCYRTRNWMSDRGQSDTHSLYNRTIGQPNLAACHWVIAPAIGQLDITQPVLCVDDTPKQLRSKTHVYRVKNACIKVRIPSCLTSIHTFLGNYTCDLSCLACVFDHYTCVFDLFAA